MSELKRIAVLFDNFGPYHVARLQVLAAHCTLLGVQRRAVSREYEWDPAQAVPFQRVTLEEAGASLAVALDAALRDFAPDVVFVPGWSGALAHAALHWCGRNQVAAVLMSDSQAIDHPRRWWKERMKRAVIAGFAGALVAGTRHRDYLHTLATPDLPIELGYDVVDNAHFRDGGDRARAALAEKPPFFLSVARFVEKKNVAGLLEAYAQYRRETGAGAWDLVILGDGELRPAIEVQREALGLRDWVCLPGFVQYDQLPEYYGRAQAFVLASSTEQWGLVVNEAMASGLPVLVSDRCGCAPDLVEIGRNGYSFDPGRPEELARLMGRLGALTPAERADMGRCSAERIARWGLETFAANAVAVARAALSRPLPRRQLVDRALAALTARVRGGAS